jgi:hypothetical protein
MFTMGGRKGGLERGREVSRGGRVLFHGKGHL